MNPLLKAIGADKAFEDFDDNIADLGWSKACAKLISDLGIGVDNDLSQLSRKGATLVYANHPTGLDPYLLSAVLGRDDSYFWGDIYQVKKGRSVAKHIIPIAPKPFWSILRRPITNWPGYIYMRLVTPSKSKQETKELNKKSMQKTLKLLKDGCQVIIFPSGGEYEFLSPKKGMKMVLDKCIEQKIKMKVYRVEIKNFGELRLLAHFLLSTSIKAKVKGYPE